MAKQANPTVWGVQYSKIGNTVGTADQFTPCKNREAAEALAEKKLPQGYHTPMVTTQTRYNARKAKQ